MLGEYLPQDPNSGGALSWKAFFKIARTVYRVGLPIALSYTTSAAVLVVAALAGRMPGNREENQAVSTLIIAMLTTWVSVAVAPLFAVNNYVSMRYETRMQHCSEISRVLKAGIFLGLPTTLPSMIVMYWAEPFLRDILRQDAEVSKKAGQFSRPYSFALLGIALMRMPIEQILLSFKKQNALMGMCLAAFAVGVIPSTLLCFGAGAFPVLSWAGMAYGFQVETALTILCLGLYLGRNSAFEAFSFFKTLFTMSCRLKDWQMFKELFGPGGGGSSLAVTVSQVSVPLVYNALAGHLPNGRVALAAQSYSSFLIFALLIPGWALAQAVSQETNRCLGDGATLAQRQQAQHFARAGLLAIALLIFPICMIVMACPSIVMRMVSDMGANSAEADDLAKTTLTITALGLFFEILNNAAVQTLRALDDHVGPTLRMTAALWIGLAVGFALAKNASWGLSGLAMGYVVSNFNVLILLGMRFYNHTQLDALNGLSSSRVGGSSLALGAARPLLDLTAAASPNQP